MKRIEEAGIVRVRGVKGDMPTKLRKDRLKTFDHEDPKNLPHNWE